MSSRRHPSGSEKRKKRKRLDELTESQRGSIDKFFKPNTCASRNQDEWAIVAVEEQTNTNPEDQDPTDDNVGINTDDNNVSNHVPSTSVDEEPIFTTNMLSRTGPLRSGCQVGPGRGTAKDTKAEDHDGNGIEQQNEVFFLLKTALLLACCS